MKSALLFGVLVSTCVSSIAADLATGTWEMNIRKSRPSAPTRRAVVTIRVEGNREEIHTRIVRMDGQESTTTVAYCGQRCKQRKEWDYAEDDSVCCRRRVGSNRRDGVPCPGQSRGSSLHQPIQSPGANDYSC